MLIVTASDDNYAIGVITLITSITIHNPGARIAVLDQGISLKNRQAIENLADKFDVKIERHEIDQSQFAHIPVLNDHISHTTYLRLLIPALFQNEDKALYVDCDMLITGSLKELSGTDLGDNLIAATPNMTPLEQESASTGISTDDYINAGLLVFNLAAWRQESITESCLKILNDRSREILFEDQTTINLACKGRIVKLPVRYNTFSDPYSHLHSETSLIECPTVIHFVSTNKPWSKWSYWSDLWYSYAALSGGEFPPAPTPPASTTENAPRKTLSRLNRRRKDFFLWLLKDPDYQRRAKQRWTNKRMIEIGQRLQPERPGIRSSTARRAN